MVRLRQNSGPLGPLYWPEAQQRPAPESLFWAKIVLISGTLRMSSWIIHSTIASISGRSTQGEKATARVRRG